MSNNDLRRLKQGLEIRERRAPWLIKATHLCWYAIDRFSWIALNRKKKRQLRQDSTGWDVEQNRTDLQALIALGIEACGFRVDNQKRARN